MCLAPIPPRQIGHDPHRWHEYIHQSQRDLFYCTHRYVMAVYLYRGVRDQGCRI